jgi:molecular chaperone DnaK
MPRQDLRVQITRAEFEAKCQPLFDRITDPITEALETANMSVDDIDDVIAIGGSCAIPRVKTIVEQYFNKPSSSGVSAQEAVARGAAVLTSDDRPGYAQLEFGELEIRDVAPFPLGIQIVGGVMSG